MAYKHGGSGTITYRSWNSMRQRCNNPNSAVYKNYGGRGIKVCKEWDSYEQFYMDMGKRPSKKYSIHRIDNDGDYKPSNCVWATNKQQGHFRRQTPHDTKNKYRGVHKLPSGNWAVRILNAHVATYRDPKEAALRYNEEAFKVWGKDACLNDV